jgi:aminoglycoside 2'-N-acetyltransferase I
MTEKLDICVIPNNKLSPGEYAEIIALTTQAFEKDYAPFMQMFKNPTHLIARWHGKLVSYAALITRWIQIDNGSLLRTGYVEGLATDLACRGQGFATQVMRRFIKEAQDHDFAALSTGSHAFYERLGWRLWQGPLYTRKGKELIAMPEERGCVMVHDLPKTPLYDTTAPMSIEWREIEPW